MIKKNRVNSYELRYYCDKCGKEVMFTGMVNLSNPVKYKHACVCGETYYLNAQYPTIDFEMVDMKKEED